MIVEGPQRILGILRAVWKPLVVITVFSLAVTLAHAALGWSWIAPGEVPLPLIGTGLVVFLGIRNNTAYARWWEARTLWGRIVNQSRNFARTLCTLFPHDDAAPVRDELILHQIAWARALRHALRREDVAASLAATLPPETLDAIGRAGNAPFAIQRIMAERIGHALGDGRLDSMQFASLNTILDALTDAQGGLERIRNTPMPQHYTVLPRVFVLAYGFLLPFGVVSDLGLLTPVAAVLIGFLFLTLDHAGANLENPFARSVHDLPMTSISRTIEIDLKDAIGDENQPSPSRPILGVLR